MITLDFETEAVNEHGRPPLPVGLALMREDGVAHYYAWGHPDGTGNNSTPDGVVSILEEILSSDEELLFHNAKFDLGVWAEMWRLRGWDFLRRLKARRVHDTMFQLFLLDPHESSISLKPSTARHLNMPPTEQKDLHDWIVNNVGCNPKEAGAYIARAPASLVAPYAKGDVERTRKLYDHLAPKVVEQGMLKAYQLEQDMLPLLLRAELRGLRVNGALVEQKREEYEKALKKVAFVIYKKLGRHVDLNSPTALAKALARGKHVTGLARTAPSERHPEGQDSTAAASIDQATWVDPQLREAVKYWKSTSHSLSHSWRPWSENTIDFRLFSQFNQVRGQDSGIFDTEKGGGARTGRLSVAWFLNIAKQKKFNYDLLPAGIPKFISPKEAILPEEGQLWIERDWRQQEFRIAAHFEDGQLQAMYRANPELDFHTMVMDLVIEMGRLIDRDKAKTINLAKLYKLGAKKLAAREHWDIDEARDLMYAITAATPGLQDLENDIHDYINTLGYVRTYYGAKILKEPSRLVRTDDGGMRLMDFIYKVMNHLIQRSAAEQMKEAVVKWHHDGYNDFYQWLLSVHDALNISASEEHAQESSQALDGIMLDGDFDVKMLSDVKIGPALGLVKKPEHPELYNAS